MSINIKKRFAIVFCIALTSACNPLPSQSTVSYNSPIIISSDLFKKDINVRVLEKASPPLQGPGGCFAGQIGAKPWEVAAAESTVSILASGVLKDGQNYSEQYSGTGWIVKGSGDANNPHNRILSVDHVVQDVLGGGTAIITTSSGVRIGHAYVIGRGRPTTTSTTDGLSFPGGDEIVLGISQFEPGSERVFDSIPGIELAPVQPSKILAGKVEIPGGTEHGTSGGPFLVTEGPMAGKVQGMLVRAQGIGINKITGQPTKIQQKVTGGDPFIPGSRRTIDLPAQTTSYIQPVSDEGILASLGMAGQGIQVSSSQNGKKSGEILGYPLGLACIVYRADLGGSSWTW